MALLESIHQVATLIIACTQMWMVFLITRFLLDVVDRLIRIERDLSNHRFGGGDK